MQIERLTRVQLQGMRRQAPSPPPPAHFEDLWPIIPFDMSLWYLLGM